MHLQNNKMRIFIDADGCPVTESAINFAKQHNLSLIHIFTAPTDEAMIFDISEMKLLGFNMLRKQIKVEPMRWYYHCDRPVS